MSVFGAHTATVLPARRFPAHRLAAGRAAEAFGRIVGGGLADFLTRAAAFELSCLTCPRWRGWWGANPARRLCATLSNVNSICFPIGEVGKTRCQFLFSAPKSSSRGDQLPAWQWPTPRRLRVGRKRKRATLTSRTLACDGSGLARPRRPPLRRAVLSHVLEWL